MVNKFNEMVAAGRTAIREGHDGTFAVKSSLANLNGASCALVSSGNRPSSPKGPSFS